MSSMNNFDNFDFLNLFDKNSSKNPLTKDLLSLLLTESLLKKDSTAKLSNDKDGNSIIKVSVAGVPKERVSVEVKDFILSVYTQDESPVRSTKSVSFSVEDETDTEVVSKDEVSFSSSPSSTVSAEPKRTLVEKFELTKIADIANITAKYEHGLVTIVAPILKTFPVHVVPLN
jgi:HSP20 family molecular chaperone IbpA